MMGEEPKKSLKRKFPAVAKGLKFLTGISQPTAIVDTLKSILPISIAGLAGLFLISCSATNSRD